MKTLSSFTTRQPIQVLKKRVTSVFLSFITSYAISTSRAEHTTSYRGRATTSFISYHQLKTWSLLSKDNQTKSWEKMWEKKWICLLLVTSHVVGTSRAEHTTSCMSCKQMKTLSSFTARLPIQISGKDVTSGFFLSLGMVPMTSGNSLLLVYIRLGISSKAKKKNENCSCLWGHQQLSQGFFYPNIQCNASKLKWVVLLGGVHWHQQSRAYNFLYVIPADWAFAIVNHKTIPTMIFYLYPYINPNPS